jgi:hypothetical protein
MRPLPERRTDECGKGPSSWQITWVSATFRTVASAPFRTRRHPQSSGVNRAPQPRAVRTYPQPSVPRFRNHPRGCAFSIVCCALIEGHSIAWHFQRPAGGGLLCHMCLPGPGLDSRSGIHLKHLVSGAPGAARHRLDGARRAVDVDVGVARHANHPLAVVAKRRAEGAPAVGTPPLTHHPESARCDIRCRLAHDALRRHLLVLLVESHEAVAVHVRCGGGRSSDMCTKLCCRAHISITFSLLSSLPSTRSTLWLGSRQPRWSDRSSGSSYTGGARRPGAPRVHEARAVGVAERVELRTGGARRPGARGAGGRGRGASRATGGA